MNIHQHRNPLSTTWTKAQEGRVTIGFIGGSITDARPRHNWPEPVIAWFANAFPNSKIIVENAAIGATGSDLAVLRAGRDLIDRGCDLVFIDYAVNDNETATERRMRTREGLIRKLLEGEGRDVILTYTYCQDMYEDMMTNQVPPSIREFEQLAEHYGLGSVWMGLHALSEVRKGFMRWEEWLPDGLHPTQRGSFSYGSSVIDFLEEERRRFEQSGGAEPCHGSLPEPVNSQNWQHTFQIPLEDLETDGPWVIRRWPYYEWIDQVLETSAVGAKASFSFEGRGVALGFDFGKRSSEFRYRIDEEEWVAVERDRPDWVQDDGWYRLSVLTDELKPGSHHLELEVIHGNRAECQGTNFRLAMVGVIQ
ncbi:SGNH/GDSL hydrolase family protein [Paenibacillus hexagrammi]|uniref:SGNH/GDSL hydrolase family protein n=1 Tax=Paenibacillus hexagrammi TaxID=2908839 RepID=A0ABY3SMF5_9BACL|nr:SGNH/GDSL hydrolase family protein [Paenibacillus sp. YPD9-1]UJF34909.1 SGNH/GDSL hydrolase family protein [Paenibacillus sp. YPD9-1]